MLHVAVAMENVAILADACYAKYTNYFEQTYCPNDGLLKPGTRWNVILGELDDCGEYRGHVVVNRLAPAFVFS